MERNAFLFSKMEDDLNTRQMEDNPFFSSKMEDDLKMEDNKEMHTVFCDMIIYQQTQWDHGDVIT